MEPDQKRIGHNIVLQVRDQIKEWGFDTKTYEDTPHEFPGDLFVGCGNAIRLPIEIKGFLKKIEYMHKDGYKRTILGRPLLTPFRHDWLIKEKGIYLFCEYETNKYGDIAILTMFYRKAKLVKPTWYENDQYNIPNRVVKSFEQFDSKELKSLLR